MDNIHVPPKKNTELDIMEEELKAMIIPVENYQLSTCRTSVLHLLNFCRAQHKANEELMFLMLRGSKESIESVWKNGNNAMASVMNNMMQLMMDSNAPRHLVKLARLTDYDVNYSSESKCITIFLGTEDEENEVEAWLLLKEVQGENYKCHFVVSGDQVPQDLCDDFKLPLHFETLEEFATTLKGGLFANLQKALQARKDENTQNSRVDLAASAIFKPE
jgi:hypothetical protein